MIKITREIIFDLENKLRYYQIGQYLDSYFDFYKINYPQIVNFFSGESDVLAKENVINLTNLIKQSDTIRNLIVQNKFKFTNYEDWEVIEYLEDLRLELITTTKISKFLRSSITNYNFNTTTEFNYTTIQQQSLENVSGSVLRNNDFDNDWINIAMRNNLSEIDYSSKENKNIILSVNRKATNFNIESVVDNITGQRVYGLDIQKKLEFKDEDLYVLPYGKTFKQSVEILIDLRKGDVPEFPQFGLSNFIGSSVKNIGFTSITRELQQVFSSDDSLVDFKIIDVKFNVDSFYLDFSVSSRLDETIKDSIQLT